jgi:ribosomal-protein-alanine N-acetyltransferase
MQRENAKKQHHVELPALETKRLLLKEFNPEIQKELFTTCSDNEIMKVLGLGTKEELEVERGKFQKGMTTYQMSFKTFLIEEKASGRIIGKCGFHDWYSEHMRSELGYALSAEETRGKGYMTEALKAIIKFGFEEMELNRIEAFTAPGNVPSRKMLRGLGFIEEGTLRSHYFKNGKLEDSVCYALLRKEYDLIKKQ